MTQPQNNFTDPYEMKRVYNNQRQSIVSVKKNCVCIPRHTHYAFLLFAMSLFRCDKAPL